MSNNRKFEDLSRRSFYHNALGLRGSISSGGQEMFLLTIESFIRIIKMFFLQAELLASQLVKAQQKVPSLDDKVT